MKQNITRNVEQCTKCHKFFTEGLEGDDGICDACFDADSDGVVDPDTEIETDTDKPNIFTEGDCV